ncbi:MAG: ABC transporter permease subunit [Anaerolineae bacterium]|nr:ABC transporter permease subunit [Anaerolineae bacterium]MCO5191237.1 ABC transporter permease subunit [Anaerolineae bacterium]MCO5194936.1 ABC transporter permease subunit [Anaerolineae bacterium]MCO5197048.1 ABC transporter permease subunit [Anaerolineae bacterium]MCO5204612.1 ABC transporter permease subunit [Anaerolineae bacterium]
MHSQRLRRMFNGTLIYIILIAFAFIMLFPFFYMMTTSLKEPKDTFRYPPRLLPREAASAEMEGFEEPVELYHIEVNGEFRPMALVEENIRIGQFADPATPENIITVPLADASATGGTVTIDGNEVDVYMVAVDDEVVELVLMGRTAFGRFIDPDDPSVEALANVRLSEPVESLTLRPENYSEVVELQGMDRSLTNTLMITILVVSGTLFTSLLGGYAFARLRFPGRDKLFLLYLGTIMIPFVVIVTPMYQLMVAIGWVDRMVSLIVPWIFSAYGTFLMRQFFITIPREIEEAATIDGASRWQILWRIFVPAATPALATLGTFTFLYAWNSFFWPLVAINTGNTDNHVLTLSLSILRGRASDSPNLILAGAAIAIIPPMLFFIFGQRFFVESATSSAVKG